jgi:hypothetical protein
MTIQLSTTLRNNMIGQYETTIGVSPKLILRTGAPPANAAAVDSGTFLAIVSAPADWVSAASSGGVTIVGGPWSFTGSASGTVGHYRLKDSTATSTDNTGTTYEQGTVTATGGGGDLTLDNVVIAPAQAGSITGWTRTQGGA